MRGLDGKRVLITGAASGIGRATALRFAEEGASVAVNFVGDAVSANLLMDELMQISPDGGHMLAPADISDEDAVDSLFAGVVQAFDGLDVLVNNAAIKMTSEPHETPIDEFDAVMAVNLRGAVLCAQAAIQQYLDAAQAGTIINVSSLQAEFAVDQDSLAYIVSKSGINALTRALALRYARDGIRINAVGPGWVPTQMVGDTNDPQLQRRLERMIPLGRMGTPEEVAAVVAFLASDDAAFIAGQTIYVDGGAMIGRYG